MKNSFELKTMEQIFKENLINIDDVRTNSIDWTKVEAGTAFYKKDEKEKDLYLFQYYNSLEKYVKFHVYNNPPNVKIYFLENFEMIIPNRKYYKYKTISEYLGLPEKETYTYEELYSCKLMKDDFVKNPNDLVYFKYNDGDPVIVWNETISYTPIRYIRIFKELLEDNGDIKFVTYNEMQNHLSNETFSFKNEIWDCCIPLLKKEVKNEN